MTKTQRSKRRNNPNAPIAPATMEALKELAAVQKQLEKVTRLHREVAEARKRAVGKAWAAGATAKELSVTLEISLAKVYTLIPPGGTK